MLTDNKNGATSVKQNSPKTDSTKANPPEPISKPIPKISEKLSSQLNELPPFEDRIQKLNRLFELQSKHTLLSEASGKLNSFKINGKDGAELTLEDSEGKSFTTRNTEIVEACILFLSNTISDKKKLLEAQIVF